MFTVSSLMKKIVVFCLLSSFYIGQAQINGAFTLMWNASSELKMADIVRSIPNFQSSNFSFDDVRNEIFFTAKIPLNGAIDESSFIISNVVYETMNVADLKELNPKSVPNKIIAEVVNIEARDEFFCGIKISPIVKDAFGYKKVLSFSYALNNGQSFRKQMQQSPFAISNSVFATGDFYRFYVEKTGVYKLSKDFLRQLGFNTDGVNPQKISVFGNGGRMIPLLNSVSYPLDVEENAIQIIGEADGIFNEQDYILMYCEGTDNWNVENQTHNNLYENRSYYYISAQNGVAKRMQPLALSTGSGIAITNFDANLFYEKELTNVARLGRKWFGEGFNIKDEQDFEFALPNIDNTLPVNITVAGVASAFAITNFEIKTNGTAAGNLAFASLFNSGVLGIENVTSFSTSASDNIKVTLKYNNAGIPGSKAYLDYIILKYKQKLSGFGKQFRFQYNAAATLTGIGEFQISNAAAISQIWDITDIYNIQNTTNNSQSLFSVKAQLGEVRKYIAIDNADFYTPFKESNPKVANQNLKGTIFKNAQGQFQDVDYLIISPSFLNNQAERLANFHRNNSGMSVRVVNLDKIYQEFCSGKQDIGAIRNFVKYVYDNASIAAKRVKYLCLFGDTSFDPKNILKTNSCIVPIYNDVYSFSLSSSFISDDFYGLMNDNEGNMSNGTSSGLDIAVGRMLVNNPTEADQMVDKVLDYHDVKSYGRWRNNFVLISDDVDNQGEFILQQGLDTLGDQIFAQKPFVNIKKIHSDSYVQETAAGGTRYPKARQDFINAFEQGALVFSYFGHGGEEGLAAERLWDNSDGIGLNNQYKYPLFVTITCEFTRFDNPFKLSGGEILFNNPKGGAISLVTTTRLIFISTGLDINNALSANLYGLNSNSLGSMAEALRKAKNSYGSGALMVFYIGDPATMLALPKPKIVLTKVNDVPITQTTDVFKALSTMKVTGEVRDETGNALLSNYSGDLAVNIFDKSINRSTLGNDGVLNGSQLAILNFVSLGETIFRGNASVNAGLFEFNFVVPRDIRIPIGNGRISFYAKKSNELLDQTGFDTAIQIGGVNLNAPADNVGPTARIYMNDETFVSGGITNESPFFLAFLEDENGINTASGIGHDILGILDGDETKPYILNDYYETEPNNYKKGKLKFPFRNLSVGLHTIKLKAWDVYNNPITVEIQFLVVSNEDITLTNVLNYPNPFVDYTQFWFTHNKPFEPLQVQVQVFTISGKVVWSKNEMVTTEGFLSRTITWDGKDDFGDRIGKGVYVYKLTVQSILSNQRTEKFEKLVIL